MFLPENVKVLIEKLNQAGFAAYAVGGAVRDSIRGQSADDYDVTTSALPHEIEQVFADMRTIATGIRHGTVTVLSGGSPVEITTHRLDGEYSDARHPDSVIFTTSVEDDLSRRDFTVNAIAYSPKSGFIDPFGGREDIENKILRCVGDPAKRFEEDALRIMRALRFASVLDFSIEEKTEAAIFQKKSLLNRIAVERLQKELLKLLRGKNACEVLIRYAEIIFEFIPELRAEYHHRQIGKKHGYDVWEHTCHAVGNIESCDEYLRLTMLLHDVGKVPVEKFKENGDSDFTNHAAVGSEIARDILKRLKFPTRVIERVSFLVAIHDKPIPNQKIMTKQYLHDMGEDNFMRFLKIRKADRGALAEGFRDISAELAVATGFFHEIKENKECYTPADLAVNGTDIVKHLHTDGAATGTMLQKALNAVICEECENKLNDIIYYLKGEII